MKQTEVNALYRLVDIPKVKIFNNLSKKYFHSKTYILKENNKVELYKRNTVLI